LPPVDRPIYEQAVAAVRVQLGEKAFAEAMDEGCSMTAEQALAAQGSTRAPVSTPAGLSSTSSATPLPAYPDDLTPREVEVLRRLSQGWTDAQIAEQLVISPRTVNNHLTSIYRKIQVSSRAAATRYALEHHLV
jgi:DNA-binding NarL/FixJ family response regulator